MPTVILLTGLPAVGKTTFREHHLNKIGLSATNFVFISSDDLIEEYAKLKGKTYNEVFEEYIQTASEMANDKLVEAAKQGLNVIVDNTHMGAKVRKTKLQAFKKYHKISVCFTMPKEDDEIWLSRLEGRPGKAIPSAILSQMRKGFKKPSFEEGFNELYTIDHTNGEMISEEKL